MHCPDPPGNPGYASDVSRTAFCERLANASFHSCRNKILCGVAAFTVCRFIYLHTVPLSGRFGSHCKRKKYQPGLLALFGPLPMTFQNTLLRSCSAAYRQGRRISDISVPNKIPQNMAITMGVINGLDPAIP